MMSQCLNFVDVVLPDAPSHVLESLIRESSTILVSPIPHDDERNLVVLLLLARLDVAKVLHEFRYHVDGRYLVLFAGPDDDVTG